MREVFILTAHLLVTLAKLARPGGLRAVAAESLAVKHLCSAKTFRSWHETPIVVRDFQKAMSTAEGFLASCA
jgi:hypothetical protein